VDEQAVLRVTEPLEAFFFGGIGDARLRHQDPAYHRQGHENPKTRKHEEDMSFSFSCFRGFVLSCVDGGHRHVGGLQKVNRSANCKMRGSRALVTWPNAPLT